MRLTAFLLGAVFAVPALASDTAQHPQFAEGKSLYKQFCSHCHGIGMVNPGTGSYDLRKFPQDAKSRFADAVQKGKGDMPAWGDILLPEEVDAIWVYVATRAGKEPFPEDRQTTAPDAHPAPIIFDAGDLTTAGTLTACLARNGGAMSGWRHSGGTGFDYTTLGAIAAELDLDFQVTWFEGEQDEFADPIGEAYALLSHGLCDIVAAHPVIPGASGPPPIARAALPRWENMPTTWQMHRQVDLKPINATAPYRRVDLAIVTSQALSDRSFRRLEDLIGTRVGVQQGTMGEALLRRSGPAEAMATAVTLPPGPKFLWDLETGVYDTTLITTEAYDFHRRQNAISTLHLTDYRHPLGIDISFAVPADREDLRSAVNAALASLMSRQALAAIAEAENVTYAPPHDKAGAGTGPSLRAVLSRTD